MKTFNKIALVTAIATAPFAAQAGLVAMDDDLLGNTTGQAGVTMEVAADISIGSIVYTDEADLTVSGIKLGGVDNGTVAITQTVDVTDAGLVVGIEAVTGLKLTVDDVTIGTGGSLGGLRVDANIGAVTQTIGTGGATGVGGDGGLTIGVNVTSMDMDVLYVDGAFTKDAVTGNITGTANSAGTAVVADEGAGVFIHNISLTGLNATQTIDVVEHDAGGALGTVGALQIGMSGVDINMSIDGIHLLTGDQASAAAAGTTAYTPTAASLGSFAINSLQMGSTTTTIYAH